MRKREEYDWIIDEAETWPPRGRPEAPFGVTQIEVIRSCPLRACFEASHSQDYPPRVGFAARVGSAFHRTLESLVQSPLPPGISAGDAAAEARRRFRREMAEQEALSQQRARERGLPRDEARIHRALEALMVEARRLAELALTGLGGGLSTGEGTGAEPEVEASGAEVAMEVPVQSHDGLFAGRIDRVEPAAAGTRLLDYKSALRDDLPERYERQLQLYAWMWHETRGEWPVEAAVVYPFTGKVYAVDVEPAACERVATESRALVETFREARPAAQLGTPGEVCQVCQYRPWCKAFWAWQSAEESYRAALDRAYYGFEGMLETVELRDHHWRIGVSWRQGTIQIVAPEERFPHLKQARAGDRLRGLEMRLQGQLYRPKAMVAEYSEIFIVRT